MIYERVDFNTVNPSPKIGMQLVSSFHTNVCRDNANNYKMVLDIAIDKYIANASNCEFPVYIPANRLYKQEAHMKMLERFRKGELWVAVQCHNLVVYRKSEDGKVFDYWGYATGFTVVDNDTFWEGLGYDN